MWEGEVKVKRKLTVGTHRESSHEEEVRSKKSEGRSKSWDESERRRGFERLFDEVVKGDERVRRSGGVRKRGGASEEWKK